jgi:hypothetical protein
LTIQNEADVQIFAQISARATVNDVSVVEMGSKEVQFGLGALKGGWRLKRDVDGTLIDHSFERWLHGESAES